MGRPKIDHGDNGNRIAMSQHLVLPYLALVLGQIVLIMIFGSLFSKKQCL